MAQGCRVSPLPARARGHVGQAAIWLLTLPLAIALWIWESGWPMIVRLVLIAGIGGWNIWMFFPFKR